MSKPTKTFFKLCIIFISLCAFFGTGFVVGRIDLSKSIIKNLENKYALTGDLKSEYNEVNVNILWEAWSKLETEYISDNTNAQDMIYGAVKGLIGSLNDPYTNFLTPKETETYQQSNKGEYEGIGATLRQEDKYVVIETVIDKSPAQKAELKSNDLIMEVDKKDMTNKSVFDVVTLIRGDAGTQVELKIWRQSTQKEFSVTITRSKIDIDNIEFSKINDSIGKITIRKFTEADVNSFNLMWDKVVGQVQESGVKKIIIDLRNNPGGYVSSVEYVLEDFIPSGSVIFIEESKGAVRIEHKVNRLGRFLNIPIVVLVNEGSASASEIFTGAIQDYARGNVIGMKTVGKGVEQKLLNLSDGSLLQVVFQKWLTPKGKNITKKEPITPDIEIEEYKEQDSKALEVLNSLNN